MRRLTVVVIAVLFAMGISAASFAADKKIAEMPGHGASYGRGCEAGHSPMAMFKKLGLDDTQKTAIRAIHMKARKEMIRKKADIKIAKIEMMEILSKDPVDMAAAETAVKKIEGLRTEMRMMHIRTMEEVKSNLNAEQKKKFGFMMTRFLMERGGKRCGCHKHRPGCDMNKMGDMRHGDK